MLQRYGTNLAGDLDSLQRRKRRFRARRITNVRRALHERRQRELLSRRVTIHLLQSLDFLSQQRGSRFHRSVGLSTVTVIEHLKAFVKSIGYLVVQLNHCCLFISSNCPALQRPGTGNVSTQHFGVKIAPP